MSRAGAVLASHKAAVGLLAGLGLLLGGYLTAYLVAGNTLPHGTVVAGVPIGGLEPEVAERRLAAGLAARRDAPLQAWVDGQQVTLLPSEIGLDVDVAGSVAAAGGGARWRPSVILAHFVGGQELDAVLQVDDVRLSAALSRIDAQVAEPPRNGAIAFTRTDELRITDPRPGRVLDRAQARTALLAGYLHPDEVLDLLLVPVAPDIDVDDVSRAMAEFAEPAVSGPVTVRLGKAQVRLRPEEFARTLQLRPRAGQLVPGLNQKRFTALLEASFSSGAPVDATVVLDEGRPRIIPARRGVRYDPDDLQQAFLSALTASGNQREAVVQATVAEPQFSTADARALRVVEQVSSFTTYYPYAEYRNINIGRAASLVDETLLKPGETFSLNDTVGERTRENGFTEGFIISDGIFKEELGGGVSQLATTLFNAMFFAGLEDVEHRPHSFYIDRYPAGREATVAWGSLDLRFRNDTPYGVLITTSVVPATSYRQGVVTVRMWSTRYWDITSKSSPWYRITEPGTRVVTTEDCYPHEGGQGFDIDVTRYFRRVGQTVLDHQEVFHTRYSPSDTVVCEPAR